MSKPTRTDDLDTLATDLDDFHGISVILVDAGRTSPGAPTLGFRDGALFVDGKALLAMTEDDAARIVGYEVANEDAIQERRRLSRLRESFCPTRPEHASPRADGLPW